MKNRTRIASDVQAILANRMGFATAAFLRPVSRKALLVIFLGGSVVASAWSTQTLAAGSRHAVEAEPGEIVVLRTVPTRSATRQAPPARAVLVDPKLNGELLQGLSPLTDEDYGLIASGNGSAGTGMLGTGGVVSDGIRQVLGGSTGSQRGGKPAPASSVGGAVTSVTGGIAGQVNGALSATGLMGQGGQQ